MAAFNEDEEFEFAYALEQEEKQKQIPQLPKVAPAVSESTAVSLDYEEKPKGKGFLHGLTSVARGLVPDALGNVIFPGATGGDVPTERDMSGLSKEQRRQIAQQKFDAGHVTKATSPLTTRVNELPEDASPLRSGLAAGLDAASAPGRIAASTPVLFGGDEKFTEALARTEGKDRPGEGIVGFGKQLGGSIVRAPGTLLGGIASSVIGPAVGGALGIPQIKAAQAAAQAAGQVGPKVPLLATLTQSVAEGLPYMATAQADRVARGNGLSGLDAGIDVAGDVLIPLAGFGAKKLIVDYGKQLAQMVGKVLDPGDTVGKAIEEAGKKFLRSGAKVKDASAKRLSTNVEKGVQRFVDDVAKYQVQSPAGGFSGISQNAQAAIDQAEQMAESAIVQAAQANPSATIDVDAVLIDFMNDVGAGEVIEAFGKEGRAQEVVSNLFGALELRGMTGQQPLQRLPEIKRTIREGTDAFKRGIAQIGSDPLERKMGALAYLRMKEALDDMVPGLKDINGQTHDLIEVRRIADEASKRIGNNNKIGLSDLFVIFGGPAAAQALGLPGGGLTSATTAAIGTGLVAKKALSGGRGASGLISAGQALQTPIGRGLSRAAVGGGLGAGVGYAAADDDEKARGALMGAVGGAGLGVAGPELVRMARSGFRDGPVSDDLGLFAGHKAKGYDAAERKFSALTDKMPRFEIDDSAANLKPDGARKALQGVRATLGDVLDHPKLYEQYPQLRYMDIAAPDPKVDFGPNGKFFGDKIMLSEPVLMAIARGEGNTNTILHEIQHAIQQIENFARGGSPSQSMWASSQMRPILVDDALKTMQKSKPATYDEFWGPDVTEEGRRAYQKYLAEWASQEYQQKLWRAVQDGAPARVYPRLAGEVEARSAASRANMSEAQRAATQPYSGEPYSLADMVLRTGNVDEAAAVQMGSSNYGLRPAIFDVETGKIYTGEISHKNILNRQVSRQKDPALEKRIWDALFKDNSGVETPYIGFVDADGRFISRADAEKEIMGKSTLSATAQWR